MKIRSQKKIYKILTALGLSALLLCVALFALHIYVSNLMINGMMTDWYMNESRASHDGYGYAVNNGTFYRISIDQKLGHDCVLLGAHKYAGSIYQDEATYKTQYPKDCAR